MFPMVNIVCIESNGGWCHRPGIVELELGRIGFPLPSHPARRTGCMSLPVFQVWMEGGGDAYLWATVHGCNLIEPVIRNGDCFS